MTTPSTPEAPPASPDAGTHAPPAPSVLRQTVRLLVLFLAAAAICVLGYLLLAVPGRWFTGADTLSWGPQNLHVARGQGRVVDDELMVRPADASGLLVVSITTSIPSRDYAAIEWVAIDVPDEAEVSLLWRSSYKPTQLNTLPLTVVTGRLLPVVVRDHPQWLGNIEGLALAVKGTLAEPIRIRGALAKPLSAPQMLRDRVNEWLAFEGWTGTSINTVTGGADVQDLPLPLLLAAAVTLAGLAAWALGRWLPGTLPIGAFASVVALAAFAWLLLDARWTWNLLRQVDATSERFAGKSYEDKRLAMEDGPLYAFVQKAKATMPAAPARVVVAADSHYFRGRAAYHLHPHNPFFQARSNALPAPEQLRPGDWILVFNRRNVQFDAAQGKLRWDNLAPVPAELKLAGRGSALFVLR